MKVLPQRGRFITYGFSAVIVAVGVVTTMAGCAVIPGAQTSSAGLSPTTTEIPTTPVPGDDVGELHDPMPSPGTTAATPPTGAMTPSADPTATATSSPGDSTARTPDSVLASMTPQQKAGQLVMIALDATAGADGVDRAVTQDFVGGVIYLGNGWTMQKATATSAHLNGLARPAGVGLYIAVDQEGGQVQRLNGAGFTSIPSALTQGAWTAGQLTGKAAAWGAELRTAGVNLNLAPVTDTVPADAVTVNAPIGQLHREFSSDPEVVARQASAFIAGMWQAGIATAVKHFPGLGRVTGNTDFTTHGIVDTVTTAADPYVQAFATALGAEPDMVMVSLATYTKIDAQHQAVFSSAVIDKLLRQRLGWSGVVISDSLGAAAVAEMPAADRAAAFVAAGGDIAILTTVSDAKAALAGLIQRMADSPDFARQVDAACLRVLQAKARAGLL